MTNLSPDRPVWRAQITRERVLLLAPALMGCALAGGVFLLIGLPMLGRIQAQKQRLVELESKGNSLPLLEGQLKSTEASLAELEQQQALLVDLVAGRGSMETFLAQLSREAAATGVAIKLYEPVPVPMSDSEVSGVQSPSGSDAQDDSGPRGAAGALQARGYDKSSVLLQVDGPYVGLLQFLRRMEQLELLVQPGDLELTALEQQEPAGDEQAAPIGPPRTRLKLTLNFFDQAVGADGDVGSDEAAGSDGSASGANPATQAQEPS